MTKHTDTAGEILRLRRALRGGRRAGTPRGENRKNIQRIIREGAERIQERTYFFRLNVLLTQYYSACNVLEPTLWWWMFCCARKHEARYGWPVDAQILPPLTNKRKGVIQPPVVTPGGLVRKETIDAEGRHIISWEGDPRAAWLPFQNVIIEPKKPPRWRKGLATANAKRTRGRVTKQHEALELHRQGFKQEEIARRIGCAVRTVRRYLNEK